MINESSGSGRWWIFVILGQSQAISPSGMKSNKCQFPKMSNRSFNVGRVCQTFEHSCLLFCRKMMDKQSFSSIQATTNTSRYAAAVFRKGLTCFCVTLYCVLVCLTLFLLHVNAERSLVCLQSSCES